MSVYEPGLPSLFIEETKLAFDSVIAGSNTVANGTNTNYRNQARGLMKH